MASVVSWILEKTILDENVTTIVRSEVEFKVQAKQYAERHHNWHGHPVHKRDVIQMGAPTLLA